MLIEHQHPHNKSIMVSVLGVPNVGKSTLINKLVGMDLSIVTPKAQTTRNRFHCVFVVDRTEVILVDTPGLHRSNQEFNKRLNEQANEGLIGADLNLLLIDLSKELIPQVKEVSETLEGELGRTWIVFTKSDRVGQTSSLPLAEVTEKIKEVFSSVEGFYTLSAKSGEGVDELVQAINKTAKSAPHHYDGGDISNKNMRFFATEYIREQAFLLLKDEIPYEVAVVVDEYEDKFDKEKNTQSASIAASILVNRASQRAIVVGSKGAMIKEIGTRARAKIEELLGGQVFLNLHVKVSPKWFNNNKVLEEIGLPRAKNSNRVWKAKA